VGFFGASGISATSSGQGGIVHVGNDGNIEVLQGNKYGYGAYGIFASGDGDTGISNHGTVSAYSAGAATGVAALSFAGDAHVVAKLHAGKTRVQLIRDRDDARGAEAVG